MKIKEFGSGRGGVRPWRPLGSANGMPCGRIEFLFIGAWTKFLEAKKRKFASSGNRTRAARVAGEHSTTEPTMLGCGNLFCIIFRYRSNLKVINLCNFEVINTGQIQNFFCNPLGAHEPSDRDQWRIQDFPDGRGNRQPQKECVNLLFWKFPVEDPGSSRKWVCEPIILQILQKTA